MDKHTDKGLLAFSDTINKCKALKPKQKKFLCELSDEKKQIVTCDPKYCLVKSAAGSGKTAVLVAKYLYLTCIRKIPKERIVYLSFNKKNVEDTAKKLKDLQVPEKEISQFAFTFHALALKIIMSVEDVWQELLEPVQICWDKAKTDHDRAEVFLSKYRDVLKASIEKNQKFRKAIIQTTIHSKGKMPYKYVSNYLDRNGIPGSCRSKQEKDIFEKLAKHGVDFAYEEADIKNHRRPDFTIYTRDNQKIIYEHFTAESRSELETINKKDGDRYLKDQIQKIKQYPEGYGECNYIFTYGAQRTIDDIWKELKKIFDSKNIAYDESKERDPQLTTDKILEIVVDKFKEVRNQIVETGKEIMPTAKSLSRKQGYVGYFFRNVFIPIEEKYSCFIKANSGYTDYADSIVKATNYCQESKDKLSKFVYDYVLVDEFQDISISRHNLLKALNTLNPNLHLVAVGDDWQSIYSFSCSDLSLFNKFKDNWGPNAIEMHMSETFRFGGSVLNASTSFIKKDDHLSSHSVVSGKDNNTELIFKSFPHAKSFKERKVLQWDFIKKEMAAEISNNPEVKCLVLSRYSNIAKWFQNELKKNRMLPDDNDEVSLTIHRAKGLTADIVFIQECQEKAIPLVKREEDLSEHDKLLLQVRGESNCKDRYKAKLEEERRLFYVALTRARKKVYILYDEDLKSEFIDEIWEYRSQ